jgi:striatin 1/3/4
MNALAAHPTADCAVAPYEDQNVRWIDAKTGEQLYETIGNQDSVACVAFDASGASFATGGHDESLRIWDFAARRCAQELHAHRRKNDEGILSAAFHATRGMLASSGADGLIKLYQ